MANKAPSLLKSNFHGCLIAVSLVYCLCVPIMLRRVLPKSIQARYFAEARNASQPNGANSSNAEAEKGKPYEDSQPEPVGFWDPSLRQVRNKAFGKWIITTLTLMVFILGVLSLYWAVFYRIENRLEHLLVYVVDFDGIAPYDTGITPLVGPTIVRLTEQMVNSRQPTLGFGTWLPQDFNNDPLQVRQAVYNWDAWAAIVVNPNATSMLYSAIATGNTSYDPLGACQLVYQDARDDTNW